MELRLAQICPQGKCEVGDCGWEGMSRPPSPQLSLPITPAWAATPGSLVRGMQGTSEPGGEVGGSERQSSLRNPPVLFVLTENQEAPAPAFSTFQPTGLSRRSSQGLSLLPESRLQALQAKAQPSPRNLGVPTVKSGTASLLQPGGDQKRTRDWEEAERLLETKPQGCYLVRFSESAVTFVLTYRSRTCCRHFLLAQLGDGRHVVLGEDSVHTRLQDLLRHYTACPLSPYGETLTEPLPRQTPEPSGLSLRTEESDSGNKSQDPLPQYSPVIKKEQSAASTHKGAAGKPKESSPPPRPKPPVRAKPQLPPEAYTSPARRPRPTPPPKPAHPIYQELEEPIAFYAMGRGSPGDAPSNIYAEVEAEELAGGEGPPGILRHQVLRKCPSRPSSGGQNLGGWQVRAENSVAGQGPPVPHQPLPHLGHTLPCNLSRQVLQDRGQAWLPLGPPQ
ncbi:hypothetical protein MC885_004432 [Smutsia gigantea]|nr:hypothetical protein MC885_004432 [Smutsia gigantea]